MTLVGWAILGTSAGAMVGILWRRAPRKARLPRELDRLLRGRQAVIERLSCEGPLDFSSLAERMQPRPRPESLADWLTTMLTDGTIRVVRDGAGRPAFDVGDREARTTVPRVTVDTTVWTQPNDRLERAEPSPAGGGAEDL